MLNIGLRDILDNPSIPRDILSGFHVFLPFQYSDLKQINYLEAMLKNYKDKLIYLSLNIPGTKNFASSDYDTIQNLLKDSKFSLEDTYKI